MACGRRYGKTILGLILACQTALAGQYCGWFAPEYRLLREAWRDLRFILGDVGRPLEVERRFELVTGGLIECWAFDRNPNAGRSRKYHRVIIDEAGHCDNLEATWTKAVRPTLTDYKGDAWFLSSPNGKNYFHTLWEKGKGQEGPWMSWQAPSYDNPYLDPAEIDAAKEELPEPVFAQEYLAHFLDDTHQQLIPDAWLQRCWTTDAAPLGNARSLAIDIAKGTGRDRTVAIVGTPDGVIALVVSRSVDVPSAAELVRDLSQQFGVSHDRIVYDAGGWAGPDMGGYLQALGIHAAIPYVGGAAGGPRFANLRTRAAWALRRRLDPDRPKLLPHKPRLAPVSDYPELAHRPKPVLPRSMLRPAFALPYAVVGSQAQALEKELRELRYKYDGAKIELEKKVDLQERLGHSPDLADTLTMLAAAWGEAA